MAGFIKRLFGLETPAEELQRKGADAERILKAAGVQVPDAIADIKKANAVTMALGVLRLPRDTELGKIDPLVSELAWAAVIAYRHTMQAALSTTPVDRVEAAGRDAQIFGARRALCASVPVTVTADVVAAIDGHLGLPPIDPTLGLAAAS